MFLSLPLLHLRQVFLKLYHAKEKKIISRQANRKGYVSGGQKDDFNSYAKRA